MKYILLLIVVFFTSFSHEYREKWVCHTIIDGKHANTCVVTVIKAETKSEAELKFRKFIAERERRYSGKESREDVHAVMTIKNATMIEP